MKIVAVIMAGGKGERFWPASRSELPKQFLNLTGEDQTMIQLTVDRLLPMINYEDIFVVTNENYVQLVKEQLPQIPSENILSEPMAKNTAPAIGFVAAVMQKRYKESTMLVLPSDHLIRYEEMFLDTILKAAEVAQHKDNLLTLGITPTYPETGYGYINFGKDKENICEYSGVYSVINFVEKPDINTAKDYLASGAYLWNSGMFVWKTETILKQFKKFLPDMIPHLENITSATDTDAFASTVKTAFQEFESVSIDYGIMEKSKNIYTIPGNFGWDDVGSWLALERINKTNGDGNIIKADAITIDTYNSIIFGNKRVIATIGLEDLVIVDTEDVILICDKNQTQDIKRIVQHLKTGNREDLL